MKIVDNFVYSNIMDQTFDIEKELNEQYFWDVDSSNLTIQNSKGLIIERVFRLGTIKEMKKIVSLYGKEQVTDTLCNLNYLDPKTLNFVSKLFNIPKNKFQCYTQKQSNLQHWSS